MTRAALLPAGSDPFLLAYWLRNFASWSESVDEIQIAVSGWLAPEALEYVEEIVGATPKATLHYIDHRTVHGETIDFLLRKTRATHVMLCEDDGFIRRPEAVADGFRFAEEGGIFGTPRESYATREVIGIAAEVLGSSHAFWPCFLFTSSAALRATDRHFGSRIWDAGETVLGHTLREQNNADTLISASYQLRAQGLPERLVENHRMSGQPLPDDAPWFHVGSLSNGHGFMFMSHTGPEQYHAEINHYGKVPWDEKVRRLSWWWRVWSKAEGAIPVYHGQYANGLGIFREHLGIAQGDLETYQRTIDPIITWAES